MDAIQYAVQLDGDNELEFAPGVTVCPGALTSLLDEAVKKELVEVVERMAVQPVVFTDEEAEPI